MLLREQLIVPCKWEYRCALGLASVKTPTFEPSARIKSPPPVGIEVREGWLRKRAVWSAAFGTEASKCWGKRM